MAVLTAGLERRRLLALAIAGFSIANLLAALAPSYAGLLAARLLLALSAGVSCLPPADMQPHRAGWNGVAALCPW
jgi:MFS transporter, DHA1 family, inner membrane transport protein